MRLYADLTPWYRLLDPTEDHAEEAALYVAAFERVAPDATTLLELGAGAGNNAFFLKKRYRCTLTDISERMLDLSRAINPECEHLLGDMRTLRLDRTFDVVLVHDAIMYMTNERDLAAAIGTARRHTKLGGAAVFATDYVRETFAEATRVYEGAEGHRAMRCLDWTWDPDPTDDTYVVDYAFLLRDGTKVEAVHDEHVEGLFSLETWRRLLEGAGFEVVDDSAQIPVDDEVEGNRVFLCRAR